MPLIDKTVVLISGANQGIGLATAIQLARTTSYHVVIGSRNHEAGNEAASQIMKDGFSASSVQLDLRSDESISSAISQITREFGVLDVLINNAGVALDGAAKRGNWTTRDLFMRTFDTNVFGTACLTEMALPLLRRSSNPKLIFVSTIMASLEISLDKTKPWYPIDYKAYDASKAALNLLAINYSRILGDVDAQVNVVCPGLVKTALTSYMEGGTTAEEGAQRIVELATAGKNGVTGTWTNKAGNIPW